MQRILYVDVEPVGEFVGEPALRRLGDLAVSNRMKADSATRKAGRKK